MITMTAFFSLLMATLVASVTPGPNNSMVLTSSIHFGMSHALKHIFGVVCGLFVLFLCIGLGLGGLLMRVPALMWGIKIAGAVYLLWFAYRLVQTPVPSSSDETSVQSVKPITVFQAALFQWVNPKAWMMGTAIIGKYADSFSFWASLPLVIFVFLCSTVVGLFVWAVMGTVLKGFLKNPLFHRIFHYAMAGFLVIGVILGFRFR